ncbi:Myosin light chain kinase 2, skeletal/cardiac muscle, partial [Pygoscelis adeliae]
ALQAAQPQGGKAAPTEGTVLAATGAQDEGKDEPGQEKALAAAVAQDGGQAEPGKEKAAGEARGVKAEPAGETAPTAPEPGDRRKAAPAEEASAAQHNGGQAASSEEKVLAAATAQDGGKDEPGKEKAPTAGGQAAGTEGKGPAVVEAQDGGKDEPKKGQASGGLEAECGGKAEPTEEKAPAVAEAEGGKAKPAEETALAAAQARDGGKEEPAKEKTTTAAKEKTMAAAKEKVPAAAKAQDGGKKAAKAEKTLADKKPAKEKAPAAVKAQDGKNKVAKAEKAPAAKKAQDGGKEEPAKEKAAASAKEKAPAAAKAQDGEKAAAKAEKTPAAKKPQEAGRGGEEPAEVAAAPAARAQGEGEKAAMAKGADKQQQPRGPKLQRPALLQSLSCPAACQREEQPWVDAAVMEMIPEEATREGPAEPGPAPPAPGDLQPPEPPIPAGSPGTPQERTLPSAARQPTDPTGATEQPGSGGQPSSTEAEPPPSPYLTPDFGKEDPFEILDDVPPPPAPFAHRIVTLRSASVSSQFNLRAKEILGGGKFGEVHTCTEKQTGLKLAAKVIRKQGAKDKEMVLLEIDVMNQLNHRNLIQLYDAIETPREIILFLEFVEGGELFERIVDDDYHLTEVDCMVFVRQICEGRGPRAPGSSPLCAPRLSGLSPFLGDNDTETLNNVLAANWYFDEETFESVSDEAKDFVSNLIIKQKRCEAGSGR